MRIPLPARVPLVIGAAVVILLGGVLGASRLLAASPKVDYRTAAVTRSNITQTVNVSGAVNASTQVRLAFKSGGKLAGVMVSVGQQVGAGDLLAKLDDTDQQVSAQQAQASLNAAQAKYDATLRGDNITTLRLSADQAQQSLNRLTANYAAAKGSLDAFFYNANIDRGSANLTFVAAQSTLATLQNDLAYDTQYADTRTATNTANTIQANLQQALVQSATLDQAITDLSNALQGLKAQLAAADAGNADATAFNGAVVSVNAALARVQSAVDSFNAQLGTAVTNTNSIIGNLNTTATKNDATLNQTRTDAATLATQLTTAQQQLISAKSRFGALATPVSTASDAVTGTSLANAQNQLANARQSLQSALNSRDSDLQSALSSLQSAQASVDSAKSALANMSLTAPVAGVVAQVNSAVGEFVGGGSASNPFILLSATGSLALHGTVGEADIATLKLGQVATVSIDALGTDKKFTGKVTNLDPSATLQQGVPVYGIDVTLDLTDPAIRAGMSGTANVIIASKRDVLVVPNLAIRNLSGRRGVQVLENGQPVDITTVSFGIANDSMTEVASGLTEGQQVILPTARAGASGNAGGAFRGPGGGGGVIIQR